MVEDLEGALEQCREATSNPGESKRARCSGIKERRCQQLSWKVNLLARKNNPSKEL
jgi:hypothetical protein